MPPIKYVGKPTFYRGKTLWEILGNLKDFGIGRYVVRNMKRTRYAEPSYFKIVSVKTCREIEYPRRLDATVEEVFRGVKNNELVNLLHLSHFPDYQLLSKEEAKEYCKELPPLKPEKILPRTAEMPPLLIEFIMQDRRKRGDPDTSEPRLPMSYSKLTFYRGVIKVAEEGETPTYEIGPKTKINPLLYFDDTLEESLKELDSKASTETEKDSKASPEIEKSDSN